MPRLKITFDIHGYMYLDEETPFDGILSYFALKKYSERYSTEDALKKAISDLPVSRYKEIYKASIPEVEKLYAGGRPLTIIRSTAKLQKFYAFGEKGKEMLNSIINDRTQRSQLVTGARGSNPYKTAIVEIPMIIVGTVSYTVEVPEKRYEEFEEIVMSIDYIGKYRKYGYGRLRRPPEIEETDEPIYRYAPVEYNLEPSDRTNSYRQIAIKPPYWKEEVRLCRLVRL